MKSLTLMSFAFLFLLSAVGFSQTTGAVYVNTNTTTNSIWVYTHGSDGMLAFAGAYPTQGAGSNAGDLSSQGSVALSKNGRLLFAVNAGSNEVTSFRVNAGALTFVQKVSSGGTFPVSVAIFGNLLYVLNAHGTSNITAFRVGTTGTMTPIANSTRNLSTALPKPAQVGFSPNGKVLVVAEISTNKIDTFTVAANGLATGPRVQNSAGPGPFGFAFDTAGHLIVSEVTNSSTSSYSVAATGKLTPITRALIDFGKAACWVVNTNNPNFAQQYSYVTNTGDSTISAYVIASNGSISLLDANGQTFVLPSQSFPLDMAITTDSNFLYVLEGLGYGGLASFRINTDGSLTQMQDILGLPDSAYGIIGN
ncbi:MAG TPA: beta-propeller fold lactonase family protein [Terriglobales bacterium]|nr:beta-propeller fold lactonase family protein [Terriglobales bacterium]